MGRCGSLCRSLWIVVGGCRSLWIVVGGCRLLWIVVGGCRLLWVIPYFSMYEGPTASVPLPSLSPNVYYF